MLFLIGKSLVQKWTSQIWDEEAVYKEDSKCKLKNGNDEIILMRGNIYSVENNG